MACAGGPRGRAQAPFYSPTIIFANSKFATRHVGKVVVAVVPAPRTTERILGHASGKEARGVHANLLCSCRKRGGRAGVHARIHNALMHTQPQAHPAQASAARAPCTTLRSVTSAVTSRPFNKHAPVALNQHAAQTNAAALAHPSQLSQAVQAQVSLSLSLSLSTVHPEPRVQGLKREREKDTLLGVNVHNRLEWSFGLTAEAKRTPSSASRGRLYREHLDLDG